MCRNSSPSETMKRPVYKASKIPELDYRSLCGNSSIRPAHQPATLLLPSALWRSQFFFFLIIPRLFPAGTGVVWGSKPAHASFPALAERQQALARVILKSGRVSLSSFIGVDGTNIVPNSGRIQINLKSRTKTRTLRHHSPPQQVWRVKELLFIAACAGLTVKTASAARNSNTPWKTRMAGAFRLGAKVIDNERSSPVDRRGQRSTERGCRFPYDRSRHCIEAGILPQTIDDTLYDASGSGKCHNFTQLNQSTLSRSESEIPTESRRVKTDLRAFVQWDASSLSALRSTTQE